MFIELMQMISANKHYGISDEIEILKGKYNKPHTLKERINKIIRKTIINGKRDTSI